MIERPKYLDKLIRKKENGLVKAVIDTNILVSAMLNPKSVPEQIITEAAE